MSSKHDKRGQHPQGALFPDKRFSERVKIMSTGCWEWQGSIFRGGYGKVRMAEAFGRRNVSAHRVAWYLTFGELLPRHILICHRCDNRKCVNPSHLFKGTHSDNMKDMARKGRGRSPLNRGEDNPKSKLNKQQVRDIRRMISEGMKNTEIALLYGVKQDAISKIRTKRTWC